jgi:hypothetical protein
MHSSAYLYGLVERVYTLVIRTSTVIPLEIWDCPGNVTVDTLGAPLKQFSTMIFVIDMRVSHKGRFLGCL